MQSVSFNLTAQQAKVAIYDVMMKIMNGAEIAPGVEMFGCQTSVFFILVF